MTLQLDPITDLVFDGHTTYTFDSTPLPEGTAGELYELVKHAHIRIELRTMVVVISKT